MALAAGSCASPPPPDVGALVRRTEEARGARLPSPPVPAWLAADQAAPALGREIDAAYPGDELERDAAAAAMLGLLPPDLDLRATLLEFGADAVLGFYAPIEQRLYVVADASSRRTGSTELESVLVHELAHALQDQTHDRVEVGLGLRGQDDLAFALGAFLEGEALYVEYRDAERQTGEPRPTPEAVARELHPRVAEAEFPEVPRAIRDPFVLQYPLGYALVDALVAEGGHARLDAAALSPPLSSEQLLHPARYLDPAEIDLPVFLELPGEGLAPEGCREIQRDTLGELGVRVWLRERGASEPAAAAAASGWGGDRAVFFACERGGAFAWLVRFDAPAGAAGFEAAARRAVDGLGDDAGLAGEAGVVRRGTDVVVSAGLPAAARRRVLDDTRSRRFEDLDAFLAAHPEVRERARALRGAAGRPGD